MSIEFLVKTLELGWLRGAGPVPELAPESGRLPVLYIAIISHGHSDELLANQHLPSLAMQPGVRLLIVDNLVEAPLQAFCAEHGIDCLAREGAARGFGANNNRAFAYFESRFGVSDADYFVCCNPDVELDGENLRLLQDALHARAVPLSAINLFTDPTLSMQDTSVRHFMRIGDYVSMMLGRGNPAGIDRSAIRVPVQCDWAAGSFLIFTVGLYRALRGFDERYFMYFEDVDICLRAWRQLGIRVCYLPGVKAYHRGGRRNRQLFSRHFFWYLRSMLRYFDRLYGGGPLPKRRRLDADV